MQLDLIEGDWVGLVDPVVGWEDFHVSLRAALVDDTPTIVGVRLEPRDGARASQVALTQNRLRTFPLSRYAAAVYHASHLRPSTVDDLMDAMERAAAQQGRGVTTAEEVTSIYRRARQAGEAPRAAVCLTLNISTRTADRYISEARHRGLLPPYRTETP